MSLVVPQEGGAELILKIINGRVKEISFAHEELVLSYRHPVTGREEESSGILRAKRINRVDVSGVPEEIAQFRR